MEATAEPKTAAAAPKTGPGSPAGLRFFVTKYPSWTVTMTPEEFLTGEGGRVVKQKAVRIVFAKKIKPRKLVSTQGELGTDNVDGGDKNANRFIGVFEVRDPGEENEKKPFSKKDKLNRSIVEFLRGHESYRKTTQDNRLTPNPELVELDWDPSLLKRAAGTLLAKRASMGEDGEVAPEETTPAKPAARVGLKKNAVAANDDE